MTVTLNDVQSICEGINVPAQDVFSSIEINWPGGNGMMFLSGTKAGNARTFVVFTGDGLPSAHTLNEVGPGDPIAPFMFWAPKGAIRVGAQTPDPGDSVTSFTARLVRLMSAD